MGGLDFSALGLLLLVVTGLGSFWLGRHWRTKRQAQRREQERTKALAGQSRQVRRAEERRQGKG